MASARRLFHAWVSLPLAALVAWSTLGGIALVSAALLFGSLGQVDERRRGVVR